MPRAIRNSPCQHDDRAAFGRFVGERRELRGVGEFLIGDAGRRDRNPSACRLPNVMVPVLSSSSVSTSPAASTARPLIARTLLLHQPVHAGDADGRQQTADGRRNQADEQRDQDRRTEIVRAGIGREGLAGVTVANRKMIVRPTSRMLSAISFGVFWRSAPSTSADHAVEEPLARVRP